PGAARPRRRHQDLARPVPKPGIGLPERDSIHSRPMGRGTIMSNAPSGVDSYPCYWASTRKIELAKVDRCVIVLLVCSAVVFVGCGKTPAPGAKEQSTNPATATSPNRIELSEPKLTFSEPAVGTASIRYRFVEGKPESAKDYMCWATLSYPPSRGGTVHLI